MLMGSVEYWHTLRELHHVEHFSFLRAPMIMAVLMSITGIVLFFGIILHVL